MKNLPTISPCLLADVPFLPCTDWVSLAQPACQRVWPCETILGLFMQILSSSTCLILTCSLISGKEVVARCPTEEEESPLNLRGS